MHVSPLFRDAHFSFSDLSKSGCHAGFNHFVDLTSYCPVIYPPCPRDFINVVSFVTDWKDTLSFPLVKVRMLVWRQGQENPVKVTFLQRSAEGIRFPIIIYAIYLVHIKIYWYNSICVDLSLSSLSLFPLFFLILCIVCCIWASPFPVWVRSH